MSNTKPIDFQSDTFAYLTDDMTKNMNEMLRNMEDMGSKDGVFTLKINVHLESVAFGDHHGETVPFFTHKIKSGFNVQSGTEGKMDGMYRLESDEYGMYQLAALGEQLDMFKDKFE